MFNVPSLNVTWISLAMCDRSIYYPVYVKPSKVSWRGIASAWNINGHHSLFIAFFLSFLVEWHLFCAVLGKGYKIWNNTTENLQVYMFAYLLNSWYLPWSLIIGANVQIRFVPTKYILHLDIRYKASKCSVNNLLWRTSFCDRGERMKKSGIRDYLGLKMWEQVDFHGAHFSACRKEMLCFVQHSFESVQHVAFLPRIISRGVLCAPVQTALQTCAVCSVRVSARAFCYRADARPS